MPYFPKGTFEVSQISDTVLFKLRIKFNSTKNKWRDLNREMRRTSHGNSLFKKYQINVITSLLNYFCSVNGLLIRIFVLTKHLSNAICKRSIRGVLNQACKLREFLQKSRHKGLLYISLESSYKSINVK